MLLRRLAVSFKYCLVLSAATRGACISLVLFIMHSGHAALARIGSGPHGFLVSFRSSMLGMPSSWCGIAIGVKPC